MMTKATNSENEPRATVRNVPPPRLFLFRIFICSFLLLLKLFFTPGYYNFDNGNHTQAMETRARKPEEMAMPETMQEPPQNAKTQQGRRATTRGR
jgi:hypothetical protein